MTKLRKKLLLSILTLALTFIALGSTTFAWFTLGNDATANAFTGTVQGGKGIDIAFVQENNKITADNVNDTWKTYEWTMSVDLDQTALGSFKQFKDLTSINGRNIKTLENLDAADSDYIEVSLYVRAMGTLSALDLTTFINVNSNSFNWNPDATVTGEFEVSKTESWNALNALRVSFTVGKDNLATNVFEFDFKNNHGNADDSSTGIAKLYADAKKHNISCPETSAVLKDTIKVGTNTDKAAGNENIDITDVNLLSKGNTSADVVATYTLDGVVYNIYEVTLRVWMEGWDGDCINAILTKSVALGFTLKASYTE